MTEKLNFPGQRLPFKTTGVISDLATLCLGGNEACQSSPIVLNLLMPETESDHLSTLAILPRRQVVLEVF